MPALSTPPIFLFFSADGLEHLGLEFAVNFIFLEEHDERDDYHNGRHDEHKERNRVIRRCGLHRRRAVVARHAERRIHDYRLHGVSHLLQEALHREGQRLVALAELVFAVIDHVGKHDGLIDKHTARAYARQEVERSEGIDIAAEYIADYRHARVARRRHKERETVGRAVRHEFGADGNDKQREHRADRAEHIKGGLQLEIARNAGEIIAADARGHIEAGIRYHRKEHEYEELVILLYNAYRLLEREFIVIDDHLALLGRDNADHGKKHKRRSGHHRPFAEASGKAGGIHRVELAARRPAEERNGVGGEYHDYALAEAGESPSNGGDKVSVLLLSRKRRYHRPKRDIRKRIRHAPKHIEHGDIDIKPD